MSEMNTDTNTTAVCPFCKREIFDSSRFCCWCGHELADTNTQDDCLCMLDDRRTPPDQKKRRVDETDVIVNVEGIKEVCDAIAPIPKAKGAARPGYRKKKEQARQLKVERRQNKDRLREIRKTEKKDRERYRSIKRRVRRQDKEASGKARVRQTMRNHAKDILTFIGYERMFKDGLCEVEYEQRDRWGSYSETLAFDDISYQSSRVDAQKNVFAALSQLYNYFGADALVQFSVVNTKIPDSEVGNRRFFDPQKQDTQDKRTFATIYNSVLNDKMREGVSNISTSRYITYTVGGKSADEALVELAHIRGGVMQAFTKVGSQARKLVGKERLQVLHDLMCPGKSFDFDYERDLSIYSPMTTKDFIAPLSLDFKPCGNASCYFMVGGNYAQVLSIRRFGSELSDDAFSDIINLPLPLCLTWFAQGMDRDRALTLAKKQIAFIDNEIMKTQEKAVAKGHGFDVAIPAELRFSKAEALEVLDNLQTKNQRMFTFTGLIYVTAPTLEEMDANVNSIIRVASRNSIEIDELHYLQKEGLNSVLPLGKNHIDISRHILTAELAVMMPFAAVDLFDSGGNYYGQSKESNNLIVADRKKLVSPIGFVCGKTGSGKSFFIKGEIENTVLNNPCDQIIVFDRAGEYATLTKANDGSEVTLAVSSKTYMNPFGFDDVAHLSRREQIAFKIDAILAQACANAAESGEGLGDGDRSLIARCVELCYEQAKKTGPDAMPTLGDFRDVLIRQPEERAGEIALKYEMYTSGALSFFNNQTNIDFTKKLIDINFRELPDSMLVFALINTCEVVRNRMYYNHSKGVRTHLYIEEIQSMFRYETVINYFSRFAKEGRKFGLLLTGITQNSIAMLEHKTARDIVANASFIALLQQSQVDRRAWSDLMGLSAMEEQYIDETNAAGDGLLLFGPKKIPFRGDFPKGTVLYELFDTDPNEVRGR